MQFRASSRYVRVAPSKARQVITHIRRQSVPEAQRILQFSPKGASTQILKTLNSAVANAGYLGDFRPDDLVVATALVEEGPMLKRFRPRSMGRATRIRKRTSHITIVVESDEQAMTALTSGRRGRRQARKR